MAQVQAASLMKRGEFAWQLFMETSDLVLLIDPGTYVVLDANPAAQRLTQQRRSELIGRQVDSLVVSSSADTLSQLLSALQDTTLFHSNEGFLLKRADGSTLHVNLSANRLHFGDRTLGMVVIRDVTAHRRAEEQLRQSKELHEAAQCLSGSASFLYEPATDRFHFTNSLPQMLGMPAERIQPDALLDLISAGPGGVAESWQRLVNDGVPRDTQIKLTLPDGTTQHLACRARTRVSSAEGRPLQIIGILQNVNDLMQARQQEAEHREALEKLQQVFQDIEGFIWEYDLQTQRYLYVSDRAVDLLGFPVASWKTPGFFESILHEDDRDEVLRFCDQQGERGLDHTVDYRVIDAQGRVRWLRDIVHVSVQPGGSRTLQGIVLDITDQERIRERLAESEERYERMFQDSPVSLWVLDWSEVRQRLVDLLDGGVKDIGQWLRRNPQAVNGLARFVKIVHVNRRTLENYRAVSSDQFRAGLASIFREDSLDVFRRHLVARMNGDIRFESENVTYTLDGERRHIELSVTAAPGHEDSWDRLYASVTDITDRKHAQLLRDGQHQVLEQLAAGRPVKESLLTLARQAECQSPYLRCAVFSVEDGVLHLQARASVAEELTTLLSGANCADLFEPGTTSARIYGGEHEQVAPGRFPDDVVTALSRTMQVCEYERLILSPATDSTGDIVGILAAFGVVANEYCVHEEAAITSFARLVGLVLSDHRQRQSLLVKTDELESVFAVYPDAMLRVSEAGRILEHYAGDWIDEVFMRRGPLASNTLWERLSVEAGRACRVAMNRVTDGSPLETVEFSLWIDQSHRDFEVRFLSLSSTHEQIAIFRDVTRLKQTERALAEASERFKSLFDNSPDAILVHAPEGRILDANPAACALHGRDRVDLIGMNFRALLPDDDQQQFSERLAQLQPGDVSEFEAECLRRDGHLVPVSIRVTAIQFGDEPALLVHIRDITERVEQEGRRREQERHLAHVSRLTMMGQLIAGVAHEIRQPLWSIRTFAEVCQEALNRPDVSDRLDNVRELNRKLINESQRVSNIITRMFSFARDGQPERVKTALHSILSDAIAMTDSRIRHQGVKLTARFEDDLPEILCDRILIEQTLVNLLHNALTALAVSSVESPEIVVSARRAESMVEITVSDNGPGLPPNVNPEQLFEGFFTTSRSGMGIGLALSRSFVEDHGGRICASGNPDGGMTFVFTLNIAGKAAVDGD